MKKLYEKNELTFAIVSILIYVIGSSIADNLSAEIGIQKIVTLPWNLLLTIAIVVFVGRNGLSEYYGLCKGSYQAKSYFYYIPLAVISLVNVWFGVAWNYSAAETALYAASMLLVGFLEEMVFRGFLFKAMSRKNVKSAIIVSSLTFGIGHFVNLLNGSGAELLETGCQAVYAVSIGYMFVTLFRKGKSLWPCIVSHGVLNALSVISNEEAAIRYLIPVSIALTVLSLLYAAALNMTMKEAKTV